MANTYFNFKQFRINQEDAAFKVGTDGVLLGAWSRCPKKGKVLDIGTGTGLLSLMIAQRSDSKIVAIEPDLSSATVAEKNIKASRWSKQIVVQNISLQEYEALSDTTFDLIITNPPYFSNSLLNSSERVSMSRHNYMLSSEDILKATATMLAEDGILSLILPYKEGTLFIATASAFGLYCNRLTKVKPVPSKPVRRLLMEFSRKKENLQSGYLSIERGDRHDYSPEYIELTKEFYLEF